MDSQLEPLRIHDYTVKATLGLATLYAKIGQQIEDENEQLPGQAAAQNHLNGTYNNSSQVSYGRHSSTRASLNNLNSPQEAMSKLVKTASNHHSMRSKRKGMIDNGANASSDLVVDVKSQTQSPAGARQISGGVDLNGQAARTKRSRNTKSSYRASGGKSVHLRSAFARVRPERSSRTEGDASLDNGTTNLVGRRNKALACKVNPNAANNPGVADARPKEYGEIWFDRYMIIARLGEGAFSQAFLAADLHCNRMGRRHDGIRLVTIKRMGLKEGTIGISDYETISMLNRIDPGERIPIVRVYGVFLHRPISQRMVEYDSASRQLLPAQIYNTDHDQHAFSLMTDNDYPSHHYNDASRLRVFGGRAESENARFALGSETLASSTSFESVSYHVCLVMEPLLGSTLHDAFPQRIKTLYGAHDEIIAKRMHIDMIRTVVRQLLVALAHMHSNSLIHADIKTTNVICVDDSSLRVKLIDFGNSVSDSDVPEYYSTFEIQTVWFRAPEVAYQRPFGRAIDIWSIGCIMCELWLGRSLFTDMDNANLIRSILKLRGPPPAQLYGASPVYLEIVRSWCGRPTPGFAPAAVGGRHKPSMHPEMSIDWDPQLRMQWLKHSLHVHDDDFVSLADALLEYDPEERLTAAEALEHPFFQGMYAF
ncbi:hypothetical protein IW140_001953 [Coemansia sp. RSA 1813]|nr:hypothetical protein LPJ74_002183 [Coemansia sp. RSA 1843]KAJ2089930.1 hypothetical protein IW138_003060 [Coemansia sp. RSA 986]KAJ2215246.1 hypothetical protein EV179_002334 [Coemansia sp. RSA 487]KAJ2570999.1 hypothetical protein IW140_001953 [Coemansia sp. RSA 1813]